MKITVTPKTVFVTQQSVINQGEFCVNECEFLLPECFDGLSVTAVFNNIPVPVTEGRCMVPALKKGNAVVGVYAYKTENDNTVLMYSPKPAMFYVGEGSFGDEFATQQEPEISRFEEYCNMLKVLFEAAVGDIRTLKAVDSPRIWELDYGIYNVCGFVRWSSADSPFNPGGMSVAGGVLLVLSRENSSGMSPDGRRFILFADDKGIYEGTIDTVEMTMEGENGELSTTVTATGHCVPVPVKTDTITENSTHLQYPTAKAVYEHTETLLTRIQGDITEIASLVGGNSDE